MACTIICSPAAISIKGTDMGVYSVTTVYLTPGSKNINMWLSVMHEIVLHINPEGCSPTELVHLFVLLTLCLRRILFPTIIH